MSLARSISIVLIVGLLIAGCATTQSGQAPGSSGGSHRVLSPNADPELNSALAGAAIGALGGPIGIGVGALLGYIHGLYKRKRMEEEAQTEVARQEEIDKELEQQIEAKRIGAQNGMPGSTGLILVKDHLAPTPEVASTSSPADPALAGEGLITVADNHVSSSSRNVATATQSEALPGAMAKAAHANHEGQRETAEANTTLEKQIASARARQQELLEALQGNTVTTPEATRAAGLPPTEPSRVTDAEGFRPVYADGRLVRKERDVDGDGRPDIVRYYDETGTLIRQEEDSRLDGKQDTWTFYEEGRLARKESDTNGDGQVDLWAFYDETGNLVRTEADTDHNAHRDHLVLYERGEMVEEQRYSPGENHPRQIATYANGQRRRTAEDTDGDGRMDHVTEYDEAGHVTKVSRNPVDAGTFTLVATYQPQSGEILREEEDLNGDGSIDVISHYEKGRLVRREFFHLPEVASLSPHLSMPQPPSKQERP